ncbi:unnamed protein product [Gongylonema pulchrum]|uniref:Peptidylprolyl isomerase n=1 Tax=Gongylonema pulchrum TaxID=637853 RepID=A0A183E2Z1_9BILA|nr:unnamed protein product [Gongylonema pulchrum]
MSTVRTATDGYVIGLSGRKLKVMNERKERLFDSSQKLALADAMRRLVAHEEAVGSTSEKIADKEDREEFASQVEILKNWENMEDAGPVADCIVFHDGVKFRYVFHEKL